MADHGVYCRITSEVEKIQQGIKKNQENIKLLNELRKNGVRILNCTVSPNTFSMESPQCKCFFHQELQADEEKKFQFHLEQMRKFRKDYQNLKVKHFISYTRDVLDLLNFGCFVSSRREHFHCNAMEHQCRRT